MSTGAQSLAARSASESWLLATVQRQARRPDRHAELAIYEARNQRLRHRRQSQPFAGRVSTGLLQGMKQDEVERAARDHAYRNAT